MRRWLMVSLFVLVALAATSGTASAQLGVGIKASGSLEVLLAWEVSENLMLEAGLPVVGFGGFLLVLAVDANAKFFLEPIEVAQVPLRPFVGVGAVVVSAFGSLLLSPHALAGVEYHLQDTPFSFFGELAVGLAITPFGLDLGVGGALGARFDF